ncbi:glycerophosphodiester phosphodiesterase [Jeotgalibacillus soli]|uniref:Glycerophosphodiester phosphodiesterase n=1 Tax=Jeotgalibacillus soli TaxID=889306 RepID=A0A0C2R1Y5_9BACL|nr:glycerophosphodiester phosphodiesterase [Jeotgalibacillus soli]KIL44325.1 glycerophosphodiester phosphodiesterase [Jeotgalibacillus soli]
MTQIFAHRGSSGRYPENTMKAFNEALKTGCDGIELDVQQTNDGELVVIHDETVNRTTNGRGAVALMNWREISSLDASYNKKKWFVRHRIPHLEEVLEWLTNNDMVCNIELKNNKVPYKGMEEKVLQKIAQYRLDERMILSSFNHQSVSELNNLAPNMEKAPLYSKKGINPLLLAQSVGATSVHANFRAISYEQMKQCQQASVAVRLYTLNRSNALQRWMESGVDAIITDYPEKAINIRESLISKREHKIKNTDHSKNN